MLSGVRAVARSILSWGVRVQQGASPRDFSATLEMTRGLEMTVGTVVASLSSHPRASV